MTNPLRSALLVVVLASMTALAAAPVCAAHAGTLETVRARGHLVCGVGDGAKGYSAVDSQGTWSGISVDFCRAVAAAVLGSKDSVRFRQLPASERFSALRSGEIDVLSRNLAITSTRDTNFGIRFPGVLVYDGLGFLVRKAQGIASALELSGARVCVSTEAADEQGIRDYFGTLKMPVEIIKLEKWADVVSAYTGKSCQVLSAEVSKLAAARLQFDDASDHMILPETASRQPVGPAVKQGDEDWFSIVRWTIYALIAAEEMGINAGNADAMKGSGTPEVRRFLGIDLEFGQRLGLSADWTQRVIKQVGNYGELFERHFGVKSQLKLDRRLNNLASKGGLHYAPSFR